MHVTACFSGVCDGGRVQDLKMSQVVFTPTRSPALVPDKKISSKTCVHDIPKADMLCVGLAVCHECKMLRVTFRYLSFHGYHRRLIRHEVMHMPCGL